MKIYFAGSIRGGRDDVKLYSKIIVYLKNYGQVLTEHIGKSNLKEIGEKGSDREIHNRDMHWLNSSDVIIAEVTTPSLGVGYEIGRALEKSKPVFCLYRQNDEHELSAMISGSPNLDVKFYSNLDEAKRLIENYFKNNSLT